MNERIRELVAHVDLQKFAELIVRECAMLQEQRSCNRHGYDKYEDAVAIKQHFGVEDD